MANHLYTALENERDEEKNVWAKCKNFLNNNDK